MNGFVENICRKVYEEKRGIITDPDQIKQCYITDDFPKVTVENTEGRKEYKIYMDFDKKNETPKHKTDLADEITQALGINGVYVSVSLTNEEMHLNKLDFSAHDKVFEDKITKLELKLQRVLSQKKDHEDTIACYVEKTEELKQHIAELESKNEQLKHDIDKMATSKSEWIDRAVEWQQKCEKLESKETEKPTKCTIVIVAKEINGQEYVRLDDFMSVVNDLQAEIGT